MDLSTRCKYALAAVIELGAVHGKTAPLSIVDIAGRRGIPEKYLVHILLQLKRARIVRSVRGAGGGYHLSRAPEEITVLDIITAIDGPVMASVGDRDPLLQEVVPVLRELGAKLEHVLRATTLRDLLDRASSAPMFYI